MLELSSKKQMQEIPFADVGCCWGFFSTNILTYSVVFFSVINCKNFQKFKIFITIILYFYK